MEFRQKGPSLPTSKDAVDANMIRRPVRSGWAEAREYLLSREAVMVSLLGSVAGMAIAPQAWMGLLPAASLYYLWASNRKFRLPFKVPMNWGGIDFGAPKPGGSGFFKAGGILYLGQDQASQEELWIENGDARRHGFFLGTTGSGKALPLDTLILTPRGWVENRDLRPGDTIMHPFGGQSTVMSIHPQGSIPCVRIMFSDGRHADCSIDHLWQVTMRPKSGSRMPDGLKEETRLMTAGDLGILSGLQGQSIEISIPRVMPIDGLQVESGSGVLSADHAALAAREGFAALGYMPELFGAPEQRRAFLRVWESEGRHRAIVERHGVRIKGVSAEDARSLKRLAWSLGGIGTTYLKLKEGDPKASPEAVIWFEGIEEIWPAAAACAPAGQSGGLEVAAVERLRGDVEMSCIKTSRDDGLYIMENHIVTHNTELLLGVVSQTLMWSSGFTFIDGKGTTEFYARAWTLAKRFGREDDLRVLNFTDGGDDPDAPAGGPNVQSNTLNPFAKGSSDQLMNLVVSLMGDAGSGNDMWKNRAMSLVTAAMKALCIMRDNGDILLDVQAIRDFIPLGTGVRKELIRGPIRSVDDIPDAAWEEMRTRGGMIELYLRALKGDFSNAARLALKAFFDTLPGFSIEKAFKGDPQDGKASEQYNFLSMQLTKPLGSLADDYGHIFRTPLGEVDIDDVVLNRRILVVLLPALQKAPEEMQNCGKIVVNLLKIMMGNASGSRLSGSRLEIVESKQTRAPSPYIVVLDEAGYYMVKGIDVMMAQARSLGFMIIIAGQDMAAMQSISAQIAETAAANASIFAAGKTVDGDKSIKFIQSIFGRTQVSVTSGYQSQPGLFRNRWVDRMDASFQEVDRVKVEELQNMMEGEFYFLFNGALIRAATFYIGGEFAENFSINKFVKVRGPTDRVPGLDQRVEIDFMAGWIRCQERMMEMARDGLEAGSGDDSPADGLSQAVRVANALLWKAGGKRAGPREAHFAWLAGLMIPGTPQEDDSDAEDWDSEIDLDEGDDLDGLMRPRRLAGDPDAEIDFDEEIAETPVDRLVRARRTHTMGEEGAPSRPNQKMDGMRAPRARNAIPSIDDIDIGESLSKLASPHTHDRHKGLIDVLVAQQQACDAVAKAGHLDEFVTMAKAETEAETAKVRESAAEFFNQIAQNRKKIAMLFVEEEIDGETGIEFLRKAGLASPLPLSKVADSSFFNTTLGELETMIRVD